MMYNALLVWGIHMIVLYLAQQVAEDVMWSKSVCFLLVNLDICIKNLLKNVYNVIQNVHSVLKMLISVQLVEIIQEI